MKPRYTAVFAIDPMLITLEMGAKIISDFERPGEVTYNGLHYTLVPVGNLRFTRTIAIRCEVVDEIMEEGQCREWEIYLNTIALHDESITPEVIRPDDTPTVPTYATEQETSKFLQVHSTVVINHPVLRDTIAFLTQVENSADGWSLAEYNIRKRHPDAVLRWESTAPRVLRVTANGHTFTVIGD